MADHLPSARMIAQLEALGRELTALASSQHDASLASLEESVLTLVRAALPGLLAEVVQLNTRALQPFQAGWPQPCPHCSHRAHMHSLRPRTMLTACGPLRWERPWYLCRHCGHGFSPADATLGLTPRSRVSPRLHAWLIRSGARTSFRDAVELIEDLTGLVVSAETIRQHTEQAGQELDAAAEAESAEIQRSGQPSGPVDRPPGDIVVETDGVMVRYLDGWHEVKLGLVAGLENQQLKAPSYVALRMSPEQFGPRLLAEAARRGALTEIGWEGSIIHGGRPVFPELAVIGDGAPWIWKLAGEYFGRHTEIVDAYHAREHIWTAARALYKEDDAAAKEWAEARVRELHDQGSEPVLSALQAARASEPEAAEVLRRERGYVQTNRERMNYPTFRQRGLPIGSGAIESGAKHVVQQRMKLPGARWSEQGAQHLLAVRCRIKSGLASAA